MPGMSANKCRTQRYSDAGMAPAEEVGELDDAAVERMRQFVLSTWIILNRLLSGLAA